MPTPLRVILRERSDRRIPMVDDGLRTSGSFGFATSPTARADLGITNRNFGRGRMTAGNENDGGGTHPPYPPPQEGVTRGTLNEGASVDPLRGRGTKGVGRRKRQRKMVEHALSKRHVELAPICHVELAETSLQY